MELNFSGITDNKEVSQSETISDNNKCNEENWIRKCDWDDYFKQSREGLFEKMTPELRLE